MVLINYVSDSCSFFLISEDLLEVLLQSGHQTFPMLQS